MKQRILVLGATSAIAEHLARLYAAEGASFVLAARNIRRCEQIAADLRVRGAPEVICLAFEATDHQSHDALAATAWDAYGGLDLVVVAHGQLPDQALCETSAETTVEALDANALGSIGALVPLAHRMAAARQGSIAVIGSVAGDRGRQSNYVYGAAKACVDVYLEGLAHRLFTSGVRVLTVKPGLVDTPMTAAFKKGPLWTSPERVARDMQRAIRNGRSVLYTPWFWRWIMLVIRALPRWLFFRTNL